MTCICVVKHICRNLKSNIMKTRILGMAMAAMLSFGASASIIYVSPNGTGSGSSYSDPAAFETGRQALSSKDTLCMLGGQYDFTAKQTVSKSGTSSQYKVIMSYPGERAILDFRGQAYGDRGISISEGTQYVHLLNFTVRYTGKNAIINYGNYCIIEGIDTYGNCDTGIQHKNGGGNLILNCDSHDNFDYESKKDTEHDFGGNADGFADKQYINTVGPNIYKGCRAWNNSDDGWDFFQRAGAETILDSCICYNNGKATFDLTSNPRATGVDKAFFNEWVGQTVTTDRDNVTGTYVVSIAAFPNDGNGNGFKIGGDRTVNNVVLQHCLSVGNFARGFDQNNNAGSMTLYNCSAYDNGVNYGFSNISGSSVKVRNCLSLKYERGTDYFKCPTTDVANCSWNTAGVSCTADDFLSLDLAQLTAARGDNNKLNVNFMYPVETSDLIDAGVEVGLAYGGSAPDFGWVETGDVTNYPPGMSVPSNINQSVTVGTAISPITFTWSGGATGLSLSELPAGLASVVDAENRTVTISGTITETGNYTVTVTTQGGTGDAISTNVAIVVKSANAKKVAYCTTTGLDVADSKILAALNADNDLNVQIVNVAEASSSSVNYSSYDIIVISPVPGSLATGMANLEQYAGQKPMLLLKPWNLKVSASTWSWGTAINTTDKNVTLTSEAAGHPLFAGLSNDITLFSAIGRNAVTAITHSTWDASVVPDFTVLATPGTNSAADAIVEVPVGASINGTTTTARFLMIGVSEASTANLTDDALKLISNACGYLLGNEVSAVSESDADAASIELAGGVIRVNGAEPKCIELYSSSSARVARTNGSELSTSVIPTGVYVVSAVMTDGSRLSQKVVLK